jgi:predicted transcriptional regulator
MSLDPRTSSPSAGNGFAIALVALAIAFFFAAQLNATSNQKKMLSWQMNNGDKQIENVKANEKQLTDIIKQQDEVVKQVVALQSEYQKIFEELLALAEDDKDADSQAIIKHYGIARNDKKAAAEKDKEKP